MTDTKHCWIIADEDVAVIETYSRDYAERIASRNLPGVAVYTAQEWQGRLRAKAAGLDTLQATLDSLTGDVAALPSVPAPLEARLRRALAALTDAAAYANLAKKSFDTV